MVIALPDLAVLALMVVALALALMARRLTKAMFSWMISGVSWIPWVNTQAVGALKSIESAITGAMDDAVNGIESGIGKAWHLQARLLDWTWNELKHHSTVLLAIAGPVGNLIELYRVLRSLVHTIEHDLHQGNKRFEEELKRFGRGIDRINTKIRGLDHRIDDVVIPRVREAEHEIAHLGDVVIPNVRDLVHGAELDITALRKWITANIPLVGTTAFVGAIAVALGSLGLGGLRCPGFTRMLSKWGCGLGGLLDALLGLAISALALENVCTLLPIAETAFGDVVGPVTHLLTEVPLGGCETPPKGWPTLSVATGPLPPPQTLGQLAA